MGYVENVKKNVTQLATLDIAIAVIMGVIARLWMLFGSPLVNVMLHASGPVGDTLGFLTFGPLFFIILLPALLRRNGFCAVISAVTMAVIRMVTGDPFAYIALIAHGAAGVTFWLGINAIGYDISLKKWILGSYFYGVPAYALFVPFWGTWPILGSFWLGAIKYGLFDPIPAAILAGVIITWVARGLVGIESLRPILKMPTAQSTKSPVR